jgi:hypothetical protein
VIGQSPKLNKPWEAVHLMNRRGEVNSKEAEVNKKFAWNFIWRMDYFMVFGSNQVWKPCTKLYTT